MAQHLWHNLSPGPKAPEVINVVVEVPKGSRNKYEYSKTAGVIKLDRVLYSALHYPGDYGFLPRSYFDDGDPLDVLVMMNEATFPGCVIEARVLAMLKMIDKGEPDYKILAVPSTDPFFNQYLTYKDIPRHYLKEVKQFFMTYKNLEGATVENEGWVGTDEACLTVNYSLNLYREKFPPEVSDI